MRANVWSGRNTVQVENVPDPKILNNRDAIVKITAICGSDHHLYDGYVPAMKRGDILGHAFMGEVVETGPGVQNLQAGDRVVVPFPIASGSCWACEHQLYSVCENSNPNAGIAEKMFGHPTAGIFGYSHITGGYASGQAEYARVPYADVGPFKILDDLTDEQVLFLSDILPTGYMGGVLRDPGRRDRRLRRRTGGPVRDRQRGHVRRRARDRHRQVRLPPRDGPQQGGRDRRHQLRRRPDIVEQLKELTGGRGPDVDHRRLRA